MITDEVFTRLADLEGKLSSAEGRRLAELAARVPVEHAIVEIGSFKGKSACYLGTGSRHGYHAPVYAVDLWELHDWPQYAAPEVFAKWREQISQSNVSQIVTPIRCDSARMGRLFAAPIGLLFIDGNHSFEAVERDFHAWSTKVVAGGVVAFHDYDNPRYGAGVKRFVDSFLASSDQWELGEVVDSMVITNRVSSDAGGESAESWTFVDNQQLRQHVARRPPQYGLDLSLVVPRREPDGIYVDTHSPHYEPLVRKYEKSQQCQPLLARVDAICQNCSVGATCDFPRQAYSQREAILSSADGENWCETQAWGGQIDFVYPYIADAARGEELRYSIRSLETHCVGTPRVWVIGDKPDWFRGRHIPHRRLSDRRHRARLDRAAKLRCLLKTRALGDEFVWMMDDVYFLQPLTLQELRRAWKRAEMDASRLAAYQPENVFQVQKRLTWQALSRAGRPLDDTTSHMPVVYEKKKLRQLFKKYKFQKQPLVDDLLYQNEFASYLPRDVSEVLYIEGGQPAADVIRERAQNALIMNHVDEAYTPAMETVLAELFPEPSSCER